jgi:transcriptional regulator with XRE-family HTH domain
MECAPWILDEYRDWGCKLQALREERGMRQEDVAAGMVSVGVLISRSQYSAIENGRSIVKYVHLVALAKVFRLSLATIVTLNDYIVEEED